LSRLPKLKSVLLIRTRVSPQSVAALERERPDIAVTVRLLFEELCTTAPGPGWNTDSVRRLGVPTSVRQWAGRRVEIVGQPDASLDRPPGDVASFELGPKHVWPGVPAGRGIAVVLRSPVRRKEWYRWAEQGGNVSVQGVFDISSDLSDHEKSVYRLSDATLD